MGFRAISWPFGAWVVSKGVLWLQFPFWEVFGLGGKNLGGAPGSKVTLLMHINVVNHRGCVFYPLLYVEMSLIDCVKCCDGN